MNWWMVLIMWSSVLVMCLQMNLTAILCGHLESSDGLVCSIYTLRVVMGSYVQYTPLRVVMGSYVQYIPLRVVMGSYV